MVKKVTKRNTKDTTSKVNNTISTTKKRVTKKTTKTKHIKNTTDKVAIVAKHKPVKNVYRKKSAKKKKGDSVLHSAANIRKSRPSLVSILSGEAVIASKKKSISKKKTVQVKKVKTQKVKSVKKTKKQRVIKADEKKVVVKTARRRSRKTALLLLVIATLIMIGLVSSILHNIESIGNEFSLFNKSTNSSPDMTKLFKAANVRIQDTEEIAMQRSEKINEQAKTIRSLRSLLRKADNRESRDMSELKNMVQGATIVATTLKKYATLDKELLAKYSKVFFLNEHYTPDNLKLLPRQVTSRTGIKVKSEISPFLQTMFRDMRSAGLSPVVVSGYRSYGYQSALKAKYRMQYGSAANIFSADQGYSEHQIGTAMDMTSAGMEMEFFDSTGEYGWMVDNAHRYGFILSYPKDNGYYQYEPWHWRFVGRKLAIYLHNHNMSFYDIPQRTINKYLVTMFE